MELIDRLVKLVLPNTEKQKTRTASASIGAALADLSYSSSAGY